MTLATKFNSLKKYLDLHIALKDQATNNELEIRFGTASKNFISKIEFDNVIGRLKSFDFESDNEHGDYSLKISDDVHKIRTEISGLHNIREYCIHDSLSKILKSSDKNIQFLKKTPVILKDETHVPTFDNKDFNFRISYTNETILSNDDKEVIALLSDTKSKKFFRHINRVSFKHPDYPIRIDLSVVKSNKSSRNNSFKDSKVIESPEQFEIEIELLNEPALLFDSNDLYSKLQTCIMHILCGMQDTLYPIGNATISRVINEYKTLIKVDPIFCGPSSQTLQMHHLFNTSSFNILTDYTVTDKADGFRKLLFIDSTGKLFYITTNLQIQFCGVTVESQPNIFNSLIDGEHITHDKNDKFINTYAAFDCYYLNGKSLRDAPFVKSEHKDTTISRYNELRKLVAHIRDSISNLTFFPIFTKEFYQTSDSSSIFKQCEKLLDNIEKNESYNYNTDGLIFTPSYLSVGADKVDQSSSEPSKKVWNSSFKWKPVEYNTIDFLVTFPDKSKKQFVNYTDSTTIVQHQIINLRVGYNPNSHGYLNPFKMVIDGDFEQSSSTTNQNYFPALFYPTNPYNSETHICHIPLKTDSNGTAQMFTFNEHGQQNELFTDNMIVEFKFVMSNPEFKQWIPIKVRYDKTFELRNSGKNFGNAYHVANANWHSIHKPITHDIIKNGIKDAELASSFDSDIYYNNSKTNNKTKVASNLRYFHNVLKGLLIDFVCDTDDLILIDIAVGKGGDLHKWNKTNKGTIKFILGIDLSRDNIENRIDGACKRFIDEKKKHPHYISSVFLQGDCSKNIKNGAAFSSDQHSTISQGIFGSGNNSPALIGKIVSQNFGIASNGFDIVSCQFALHYFFKDKNTLKNFVINLVECTALNGKFIGTCFDGKLVFDLLRDSKNITYSNDHSIIVNIIKNYSYTSFPDDVNCLGYPIDVFQESINQSITEYLVNFDFFIRIMENYGFSLMKPTDNHYFNNSIDSFEVIHNKYTSANGEPIQLSDSEKQLSFLNKYFIFQKIVNVNVEEVIWEEADIISLPPEQILPVTKKIKLKKKQK